MIFALAIPSYGRAPIVATLVRRLARQTRSPDMVIIVGASSADVDGLDVALAELAAMGVQTKCDLAPKGSCSQRNHALAIVDGADLLAFIDDDYFPADDFVEQAVAYFQANPDVVGANGVLLADGARTGAIALDEIDARLAGETPAGMSSELPREALYGCNMVLRVAAIQDLRFDENLPLYGWQEDIDFTTQLAGRGRLTLTPRLRGVHLGVKAGKSAGTQLGYSQIANPLYLLGKGTIPPKLALKLLFKNPLANILKLARPEPTIDRLGRLKGSMLAVADLARGRLHPTRILELR